MQNLSVIFAHARCHLSCQERLWQAVRAKPLRHACGVPPPLIRGGFAAVKFYRNTVCYCETKSLCQWLPFSGELSSGSETERLDKGRLSSERNNAGAALYNLSVIFASLDATSPVRRGFGIPSRFPAKPNQFHRKRNLFAKASHFGRGGIAKQ